MGTGCGNSSNFGRCPENDRTSSHCVVWQGESFPTLGICTGDTLTEVEDVVLRKILDFAEGKGIKISDLSVGCEDLNTELKNSDKTLFTILDIILKKECSMSEAIKQLQLKVDGLEYNLNYEGLCESITTNQQGQQCVIDTVKSLKQQLTALEQQLGVISNSSNSSTITQIVNNLVGDTLAQKIQSCNAGIQKQGSGANTVLNFVGIVPPGGYLWGEFDISKFDSTGMGTDIYCGYALANGRNNTIDMRNEIPSMASNIPGVSRSFDIREVTSIGDRKGANFKVINKNNVPDHEHEVNDPGHKHDVQVRNNNKVVGKNSGGGEHATDTSSNIINTGVSATNITVGAVKGEKGVPFDVRQSTIYQVWVKRVSGFSSANTQQPIVTIS